MRTYTLPWPPSVNHYIGKRVAFTKATGRTFVQVYLKAAAREYQQAVKGIVGRVDPIEDDCMIALEFYPPDRRRRDLDNLFKVLMDSLEAARVVVDDKQFVSGSWSCFEPVKDGRVVVEITTLEHPQLRIDQ